jgi:hypothetical protein
MKTMHNSALLIFKDLCLIPLRSKMPAQVVTLELQNSKQELNLEIIHGLHLNGFLGR